MLKQLVIRAGWLANPGLPIFIPSVVEIDVEYAFFVLIFLSPWQPAIDGNATDFSTISLARMKRILLLKKPLLLCITVFFVFA